MDPDLLEQWRSYTADCSVKLMGTLIDQAKRRMEEQIQIIDELMKEREKVGNTQEIQQLLTKMEERIKKKEDEIKMRKAHKFNRDKKDYELGRIYTFACENNTLRVQDKINPVEDTNQQVTSVNESSDLSSSADEAANLLDFHGEMRLMQMVMPQSSRHRGRDRGGTRREGGRGRNNKHQS
ncbi:hypothetical protein NDU88_003857 [Pleurodeles waltl]|uniref:Uncharacterized protein n=1 Tax=Pleurodeles waltl TaxID=8319 RepID=A0AAV7WSU8_PLEWA|nr:hypothetical protein NDU88_003857 [Pleurodeles waltl]